MAQIGLVLLVISLIAALFYLPWPFVVTLIVGVGILAAEFWSHEQRNISMHNKPRRPRS